MIVRIELQEPFKSIWRTGSLVINPENRRNVCLYNNERDRTTISYARYLMCVKLGYILSSEYEVDHKDDDKTNDDINNLQILTQQQNSAKSNKLRIIMRDFICVICKVKFTLDSQEFGRRKDKETPTCSKSCGYKKSSNTLRNK